MMDKNNGEQQQNVVLLDVSLEKPNLKCCASNLSFSLCLMQFLECRFYCFRSQPHTLWKRRRVRIHLRASPVWKPCYRYCWLQSMMADWLWRLVHILYDYLLWNKEPGPSAAITKTITITTQRERTLLVELLHAEHAHAHSTNGMHSLCVIIVIVLVMAAVGPGLYFLVFFFLSAILKPPTNISEVCLPTVANVRQCWPRKTCSTWNFCKCWQYLR